MKAWLLAVGFAVAALAATPSSAQAQGQGPFGCGTFCVCKFGKMHFHGPLYNYGPYAGYYPFEPYGPWTSDLRYNPGCNNGNCGINRGLFQRNDCNTCGGWNKYALTTWKNIFHRTHPCGEKSGCNSCCK